MNNLKIQPPSVGDIEKGDISKEQHQKQNGNGITTNKTTTTATTTILNQNNIQQIQEKKSVLLSVFIKSVVYCLSLIIVILTCYYMGWLYGVAVAIISIIIVSGKWRWIYIALKTGPRDSFALYAFIKLLRLVKSMNKRNAAISDIFIEHVKKTPEKACIVFENQSWTFREINEFSNKIASYYQANGYKKGDVIALFMENRPEFVATWLGLSKIGIIVPLINTNLRQKSLLHSIVIANCKGVIYGESLTNAIDEITTSISDDVLLYQYNDCIDQNNNCKRNRIDLKASIDNCLKTEPIVNDKVGHHDKLLYIYTSGTTGLPKAAVITHARFLFIVAGITYTQRFSTDDIFYTPLPLYHTAGGCMSIGQALLFGSTVVIRKKFSASGYFVDCEKYKCTVAQYIGEMCRYVLATPQSSSDTKHNLRMVFGNGLRPQIWPQFIKRFNIKRVGEFYGATEGNANICNMDNTVGAIGFVSRILPQVYPISIIKADSITGEPIRGPNGLCQVCGPNEPGVFIGKIIPGNPSRAFLGYVDKKASDKKIVHNVFTKGDSAFLSGDILVADEAGYLFFKDRTGDTFRWKGENVSTSEVEAQVSNEAGYSDCVVYGVEIPHIEGKAGMAAILDPEKKIDLTLLAENLKNSLPTYARPQFIRLLSKVDMTGTFKMKKLDLQKDGFDPKLIEDNIYYLCSKGTYEILTSSLYQQICNGEIRL